jgi:hypothetical protein
VPFGFPSWTSWVRIPSPALRVQIALVPELGTPFLAKEQLLTTIHFVVGGAATRLARLSAKYVSQLVQRSLTGADWICSNRRTFLRASVTGVIGSGQRIRASQAEWSLHRSR